MANIPYSKVLKGFMIEFEEEEDDGDEDDDEKDPEDEDEADTRLGGE